MTRRHSLAVPFVAILAGLAAGCGGGSDEGGAATVAAGPGSELPTFSCDESIGGARYSGTDLGARVVLGVISVPPATIGKAAATGDATWPYAAPVDLVARAKQDPVDLIVPKDSRARVAISLGSAKVLPALRVPTCPSNGLPWNAFAGAIHLKKAVACVPLTIRHGGTSETVQFGIGMKCPKSG